MQLLQTAKSLHGLFSAVNFTLTERGGSRLTQRLFFTRDNRDDLIGEGQFNFMASDTPFLATIQIFVDVS